MKHTQQPPCQGTIETDGALVLCEKEPPAAAQLAGERLPLLRRFTADLATRGEQLGLIGPQELPRLWTRHILNSALLADYLDAGATVADIGTGGGMPGLVLGIIRPDVEMVLIEPMARRCEWLNSQIAALNLTNTTVKRGRAEDFHGALEVDQLSARAVSSLAKLLPITAPLVKPGGELLFLKGATIHQEIAAAAKQIRKYRITAVEVKELGAGVLSEITRVCTARVSG